jgi:serine/threonine-protein kinase
VILYQFLTGEKPFTGNNTTIMYKVLREEPLAPSVLNVALPAAFDAVVKKAMAKSPDDRYQTAAEFATAIRAAVADKAQDSTVVTPRPQPARVADQNAVTAAQPVGQSPTQSRTLVVGGALFAVVTALLGGYVWNMRTKPVESVAIATTSPIKEASTVQVDTAVQEPGTLVISALGLVDPKDPKFNGDAGAAQTEVRADASRQLIEKALTLYMEKSSIDQNYALISQKILANSSAFIKTVIQEGAPSTGKDGLLETETRAVVKVREVQKALNQLSKDERINFIRNNGDPKVAIQMAIRNADTSQALPAERSMLAENVVKERIKSFGFRVWSSEGDIQAGPNVKAADFQILGEVRVKQLSARLEASGITINKTTMTSWTLKATDKTSGEEIYLNTVTPTGKSWATEDQALGEIGKLVGDEFSKNFFLQHFNFGSQKVNLTIAGVPDAQTARLLLRELRGVQQILDAQLITDTGKYQLQLAEGGASDIVGDSVFKPLNVKMGQGCLLLAGSTGADISATFAAACAKPEVLGRLETVPPAGLINAPGSRSKPLLKASSVKML